MNPPTVMNDLAEMARYLAGDFSNQEQAWENPPFYAHIRVCYRPLPWGLFSGFGFYVEQAYAGHLEDPYRTAVVQLVSEPSQFCIRNYRLLQPLRWRGAAREDVERLRFLTLTDLAYLPGCDVLLQKQGSEFVGTSQPGQGCCVERKGQMTYLVSTVRLSASIFSSHDQGFDPQTHQQVWGALAGPFRFQKWTDYSSELADNWGS
ncbi:MAG: chromophore lyase CpcT/CpeT [Cyanobacteriota bacterium]|nr:chromophore lyase CpcT/CpeT [Cyanobacteriota bacterium]